MVNFAENVLGIKQFEYKSKLSTDKIRSRLLDLDQQPKRFQYNFTHVQIPDVTAANFRVKLFALRRYRWMTLTMVYLDGLVSTGGDRKTVFMGKVKYGEAYYFGLIGSLIFGLMVAFGGRDPAYPIFGTIFAAILWLLVVCIARQQHVFLTNKVRAAMSPLVT